MRRKWWDTAYHGASISFFFIILSCLVPCGLALLFGFQFLLSIPIGWALLGLSILSPLFFVLFLMLWWKCMRSVPPIYIYLRNILQVFTLFFYIFLAQLAIQWRKTVLMGDYRWIFFLSIALVIALIVIGALVYFKKSGNASRTLAICYALLALLLGPPLCRNLLLSINIYADHAEPCSTVVAVAKVDMTASGKWYVNLEDNEYLLPEAPLPLTKAEADATQPGDLFVLSVHPGALGVPWAAVEPYTES